MAQYAKSLPPASKSDEEEESDSKTTTQRAVAASSSGENKAKKEGEGNGNEIGSDLDDSDEEDLEEVVDDAADGGDLVIALYDKVSYFFRQCYICTDSHLLDR